MPKSTGKNFIKNLLLSPLIKHQSIFPFICRKYCISKLLVEVFTNKIKNSASSYLQTQKSLRRNLLKLASSAAKQLTLK